MSDKNHKQIDGRLIQTNKKYSQLKLKQKELIASWMYEETKAYYDQYEKIKNPKLCGICHWTKVGIRKVVFLYRTKEFEAEPDNSKGNEVYWISEKEIPSQDLAPGMEQAWKIMQSDNGGECSVRLELAD